MSKKKRRRKKREKLSPEETDSLKSKLKAILKNREEERIRRIAEQEEFKKKLSF